MAGARHAAGHADERAAAHPRESPRRIPALDGLRACAILLVVAAHTGQPQNPALGAAGVTLFFVLSGYLITSILLQGHVADGRAVRLRSFYARRARRLLPALAILLAFDVALRVASGQTLVPVFLAAGYATNVQASMGEWSSLTHTWSLAMEEQFYLLWPLLLPFLVRLRRPVVVLAWAAVASAGLRLAACLAGAWAFGSYSPVTRADGLLVGCALAFKVARGWRFPGGWVGRGLTSAALAVFVVCFVWGDGVLALLPLAVVASAVLVARCIEVTRPGLMVSALQLGPLRYVGRVSYGVYLWHAAVLGFVLGYGLPVPFVVVTLVSLVIASVSWVLVERPVLQSRPVRWERTSRPAPSTAPAGTLPPLASPAAGET
ncbi:acyltransferase family protein [Monashia sp. NPDC004114]